ncbi:MAG: 2OG-Fe(II) oxygenase [Thermoanaerobaculia bacterium]|nr:2OG-Fe(II) oxygenase [Thermoanaerobaculia bacterium]
MSIVPWSDRTVLELATRGWTILRDFLPPEIVSELREEAIRGIADNHFHEAGIGRGSDHEVENAIRGDKILWLDPGEATPAQQAYWRAIEDLQLDLNRGLFLSLVSCEAQFAVYGPGAFYKTHVDRFEANDERMISFTLYLNDAWRPEDGGALRLHVEGGPVDVLPAAGTMVVFRSDSVPHEVLVSTRERYSLTGWFMRRSLRVVE